MKLESVNAYEGIDDVNALVEIWPGRDIAAGWRDIETPCASLPTRSPSQPCTPARKAGVVDLRKWVRARDWLSAGEGGIRTLGPRVMGAGDSGRRVPALGAAFERARAAMALQRSTKVVRPNGHPEFR